VTEVNSLATEDPIARNLARIMRDGIGAGLNAAVTRRATTDWTSEP
jgi:hypothetical protein